MPYIKAHPFGYKKTNKNYPVPFASKDRIQTVTVACPYEVTVRNEEGNPIMVPKLTKRGLPTKQLVPLTQTYYNLFTKVIQHYKMRK